MASETERNIEEALDLLMLACGFEGESGTETLFYILYDAVERVINQEWHIVEDSFRSGCCYNINGLLASTIAKVMTEYLCEDTPGVSETYPIN